MISTTNIIERNLNNFRIQNLSNSSKVINNLINNKNNTHIKSKVEVYDIQCQHCNKEYVGDISRIFLKVIKKFGQI